MDNNLKKFNYPDFTNKETGLEITKYTIFSQCNPILYTLTFITLHSLVFFPHFLPTIDFNIAKLALPFLSLFLVDN